MLVLRFASPLSPLRPNRRWLGPHFVRNKSRSEEEEAALLLLKRLVSSSTLLQIAPPFAASSSTSQWSTPSSSHAPAYAPPN